MSKRERDQKTNAMRELERAGIAYELRTYDGEDAAVGPELGVRIAASLGEDPDSVFKTLVCVSPAGAHVVCCIPVGSELDLKRAAAAAGEKSLSMMHVRDLEATTGYLRGACSPVGMRKAFPTLIDETAQLFERIGISGGRRGVQLILSPEELARHCGATFADVIRDPAQQGA
ncbi:MAG: Cys-tRNA(Pro) deacylase [Atopobiaceae bacterium]|jgi:Cys-tRNA(Pro)/Cys-tRNA(Cys) deacylase|nr:Cys-tRNA(Pro) deacylase [Atopobiaceae bacterium]